MTRMLQKYKTRVCYVYDNWNAYIVLHTGWKLWLIQITSAEQYLDG